MKGTEHFKSAHVIFVNEGDSTLQISDLCKWRGHNSSNQLLSSFVNKGNATFQISPCYICKWIIVQIVPFELLRNKSVKSCVPFIYIDHMSWFEVLCPLHLQRSHELIWRVVSPSFTKIIDLKSCVPFIYRSHELIWRVVSPSFTKITWADLKSCAPFIYKNHWF
jgi:hypothetical protein